MRSLKILEEENIHVIVGVGPGEVDSSRMYLVLSRLSRRYGRRRFTIHVVSSKPRPLHLEELRGILLKNIAYTLVLRYHGYSPEGVRNIVDLARRSGSPVHGIVLGDFHEIARVFESLGIEYEVLG